MRRYLSNILSVLVDEHTRKQRLFSSGGAGTVYSDSLTAVGKARIIQNGVVLANSIFNIVGGGTVDNNGAILFNSNFNIFSKSRIQDVGSIIISPSIRFDNGALIISNLQQNIPSAYIELTSGGLLLINPSLISSNNINIFGKSKIDSSSSTIINNSIQIVSGSTLKTLESLILSGKISVVGGANLYSDLIRISDKDFDLVEFLFNITRSKNIILNIKQNNEFIFER